MSSPDLSISKIVRASALVGCLLMPGLAYGAQAHFFTQKDGRLMVDAGASLPVVLESSLPMGGRTPITSPLILALTAPSLQSCRILAIGRFTPSATTGILGILSIGGHWSIVLQKMSCDHRGVPVHGVVTGSPGRPVPVPRPGDRLRALFTRSVSIPTGNPSGARQGDS